MKVWCVFEEMDGYIENDKVIHSPRVFSSAEKARNWMVKAFAFNSNYAADEIEWGVAELQKSFEEDDEDFFIDTFAYVEVREVDG